MDTWEDAEAYERYMGRWSRRIAREFVRWLRPPSGARWLDVGCGTGALSEAIVQIAAPSYLVGVDPSPGLLEHARKSLHAPMVTFELASAEDLPFEDGTFDVAVSGLVINLLADPLQGVREMARVVSKGGLVGLYVWDYAEGMQFLRYFWDAARTVDPSARELDEAVRFPVCDPVALQELLRGAHLQELLVDSLEIETTFSSFDDYWQPFLGGQGPAPGYVRSLEAGIREELRLRLLNTLPIAADGSIPLRARAWCARGLVQAS
ncbi:Methyltransferase type 11 [Thermobaculum terrenum ATCC BAA-798]|uniref:Methyltransferase type 11 n=1 Tax=Thermobaculum terrenum (strain ATCC BAA-798 / CCMEE 7001 / YNP1) TaxID=525904 RepID=D1CIS4_THET1|nr:methyltransferase domain-containing protein [Thermobaculum terrenum]ACZ43644.1 Methyltransferase type 11 [Thermobaculum terrenum ATCC BAA-798]